MSHPSTSLCYCGSGQAFNQCCEGFIKGTRAPETAEQLMRSRFSAYCLADYQYILDTYCIDGRATLSKDMLGASAQGTQWLSLDVLATSEDQVEFVATYRDADGFGRLHERSDFVLEEGYWRYTRGDILPDSGAFSPGRNDLCPCNSGKKFKKCCGR